MTSYSQNKVVVYTDGGAINNPGPAAIGVVIRQETRDKRQETKLPVVSRKSLVEKRYSEYIGKATNNQAEYKALIFALKKLKALFGKKKTKNLEVKCHLDSKLLVEQLNGKFKIKEKDLRPLFLEVWNLKIDFGNVNFKYVPREKNKEADALVKAELS